MKKQKTEIIMGLFLIIFISYLIWLLIDFFISSLSEVDSKTAATILGTMITVLSSVFGLIYTQSQIKQREIAEAHRTKKITVYNKFIVLSTNMMASVNGNLTYTPYTEKELADAMFDFQKDLLLWGSPKVIKALLQYQDDSVNNPDVVLGSIHHIFEAMREDIGLNSNELKDYELIKLFVSNPDYIDKILKNK